MGLDVPGVPFLVAREKSCRHGPFFFLSIVIGFFFKNS